MPWQFFELYEEFVEVVSNLRGRVVRGQPAAGSPYEEAVTLARESGDKEL